MRPWASSWGRKDIIVIAPSLAQHYTFFGCTNTMPFIFLYRTTDIIALSRNLDSAEIYISCSVHKCEWNNSKTPNSQVLVD